MFVEPVPVSNVNLPVIAVPLLNAALSALAALRTFSFMLVIVLWGLVEIVLLPLVSHGRCCCMLELTERHAAIAWPDPYHTFEDCNGNRDANTSVHHRLRMDLVRCRLAATPDVSLRTC